MVRIVLNHALPLVPNCPLRKDEVHTRAVRMGYVPAGYHSKKNKTASGGGRAGECPQGREAPEGRGRIRSNTPLKGARLLRRPRPTARTSLRLAALPTTEKKDKPFYFGSVARA